MIKLQELNLEEKKRINQNKHKPLRKRNDFIFKI
jgi:hypothetical protein